MSFEIAPGFFVRFAQLALDRSVAMRAKADACAAGSINEAEARRELAQSLHDLTGEARMLGLHKLSLPVASLSRALRGAEALPSGFWARLGPWLDGCQAIVGRAASQADESQEVQSIAALERGLAEVFAVDTGTASLAPTPRRHRLLLLDDSEIVRELMAAALEERGYPIEVAGNLAEFDAKLRSFSPEVIVTDVNMPELEPEQICSVLRLHVSKGVASGPVPIVLMSSIPPVELRALAARVGADASLSKPEDVGELVAVLDTLASGASTSASAAEGLAGARTRG